MKYLAKYENEPMGRYGFAIVDERKKNELPQMLVPAKITFIELSDLEVVVLSSLFKDGRFGEWIPYEDFD